MTRLPVIARPRLLFCVAAAVRLCAVRAHADPEMDALEAQYKEDRRQAVCSVLARYTDQLNTLLARLTAAGDSDGAAKIRAERALVLPAVDPQAALALPDGEKADADDFAFFEDVNAGAGVETTIIADIDSILAALSPGSPAAAPARPAPPPTGAAGRRLTRRVLTMKDARVADGYTVLDRTYWNSKDRRASWALTDLAPGTWEVVLRYSCDDSAAGGTVKATLATQPLEMIVPGTGSWKRRSTLRLGPFTLTEGRADLILEAVSLKDGASALFDLQSLLVRQIAP